MHLRHILKQTKKVKLPSTGWYVFTLLLFLGFLIFEVTRMSYAQTAFKYPTALPPSGNPPPPAAGGGGTVAYDECSGALFLGLSDEKYDTAIDYLQANTKCDKKFPDKKAHVCTTGEMLKTIKCNPSQSPFDQYDPSTIASNIEGWVNNGPATSLLEVNDCRGWSFKVQSGGTSTVLGAVWAFIKTPPNLKSNKFGYGTLRYCREVKQDSSVVLRPFTCCGE